MLALARRALLTAAAVAALATTNTAQQSRPAENKEPTGAISGRITIGDGPAVGVPVLLVSAHNTSERPVAKTFTNQDGRYQLNRLPAGQYVLQSFAPAYVASGEGLRGRPGKAINLDEGESIEHLDIALTRGGVITGRVVEAGGQPLIQQQVQLWLVNDQGQRLPAYLLYSFMYTTDDRGVYRLFGVPPGRYLVSAGVDTRYGGVRMGANTYSLTYHPDVTEQSKATIVEVTGGGEATGVDITVGHAEQTYAASGRVIDAETGRPVPGMNFGFGTLSRDGTSLQSSSTTSTVTNARGGFRIDGVLPGRYVAFATSQTESEFYSDPVPFEITDADVSGLEIKIHRGSSISGVITIEGSDPDKAPKLAELRFGANTSSQGPASPRYWAVKVNADGSFLVSGLKPGKLNFFVATYPSPKGARVLRIERDGVEQRGGVDVADREFITGIRVVIGFGTSIIRGQISAEGGPLPDNVTLFVNCRRLGSESPSVVLFLQAFPDVRGRFVFDGLAPGDYELTGGWSSTTNLPTRIKTASQTVTVGDGVEVPVNLILQISKNN